VPSSAASRTPRCRLPSGNVRAVVVNLDPERLRADRLSPDDVVAAMGSGNLVVPSGNARIHDLVPMVPSNAMVVDTHKLGDDHPRVAGETQIQEGRADAPQRERVTG
jgi:multidrug efflux pump subunit AcrB